MQPALDQLQKIVSLETTNGYQNQAVIGGLPKMLVFWEPNARRTGLDPAFIEAMAAKIRIYPDLSAEDRPAAIQVMLQMVRDAARAAAPQRAAAPPEPGERPASHPPTRPTEAARPERSAVAPPPPEARRANPSTTNTGWPAGRDHPPAGVPTAPATSQPTVQTQPPHSRPAKGSKPARPQAAPQPRGRRADVDFGSEQPVDPRPRRPSAPRPLRADTPLDANAGLEAPLTVLRGVGPETAALYARLGLTRLRDVLMYFPRRYDDYSQMKTINRLEYGEECSVIATVWEAKLRPIRGGRQKLLKVVLSDGTGALEATFFNQERLVKQLTPGRQIVISGRIDQYLGRLTIRPDEWEDVDRELLSTGRIVPVYRRTTDLSLKTIRKMTSQVVQFWAPRQPDPLPPTLVEAAAVMRYADALGQIHFPDSQERLAEAQHRLAFDELLLLQLGALRQRREWQAHNGEPQVVSDEWLSDFLVTLPYPLTGAQQRALDEIRTDMARDVPMNRLLQGDVGSGKTAVAACAMAVAIEAGAQAALMAPTSILAEQHHRTLLQLLAPVVGGPEAARRSVRLLQSALSALEKQEVYAALRSGEVKAVVGTHALIEGPVEFANLGLVIVDEQHRFGVAQRAALRAKGGNPHLLVMTATPIPRSLALTVYGDLDLTLLDEMPPGRKPIRTHLLRAQERERGYAFIRNQLQQGRQAFVIFPLVEESDKLDAKAAVAEHERLQANVFADYKLGLLHGRMRPDEKDVVMAAFRTGEYHVLVSTSVVEVGVDVPNATVILIEGANRFGLAQLHQFRGRVGRGEHASFCLLVSDVPTASTDQRLHVLEQSQDGFFLAEKDLEFRGPGDFLGTRQSGFAALRMARLSDLATIEKARRIARQIFERDPELQAPECQLLASRLAEFWAPGAGDAS
ncbi:MAG: ATP-dependent DNA helicase RecG [Anaerolineales bacterium]|nr:ATP-dependent DNA helicase RecG [Anaerolineales bacterium]